ncbi:MAG TPA: hypothetical protein VJL59_20415, partial [Anaerolineales bacterium]|nr:hypothetical protein [Anaerolineales bacterium]
PASPAALPGGLTLLKTAIDVRVFDNTGEPIVRFDPLLTACLPYTETEVRAASGNTANFVIMIVGDDGAWNELPTTVDTATRTVCADTDRLDQIGLFSRVAPAAPPNNNNLLYLIGGVVIGLLALGLIGYGVISNRRDKESPPYGY